MFLRKLLVMAVPLLLCLLVCLAVPLSGDAFFSRVITGALLGAALALLLPLSGAVKRREPFGVLLWVPTALLLLVVVLQYLQMNGRADVPVLALLAPGQPNVVLVECAFIGFMLVTCIRTKG